ncbi:GNAT family N-acetyltransferase [Acinetobacter colistiniresistens]|uniref:GNAT family N-acetyltransferase n=1 Tax=Acinetobacter colistiniresistens TaxID=280145 RepID=S3T0Z1_9GAMM|nr:GNAT family N-acetyltransferase [Acinetobacter colistiniresistens]EPG34638.1 hypothetical protein F907_03564 [Acinetobacter colistiniresistens]TVT84473.1 GNAT family N-acetyltransferase [Acinetobacter colistiniresistens]
MYKVKQGSWDQLQHDAKLIRALVFIEEQGIPDVDEWDDQDAISQHFVIYDQEQPIATARVLPNNSVGRVAVLKTYRGQGLGQRIMLDIIAYAQQQGRAFLHLSSQVHAMSFYQQLGFTVKGDEYDECGIPHIEMVMPITGQV